MSICLFSVQRHKPLISRAVRQSNEYTVIIHGDFPVLLPSGKKNIRLDIDKP